MDENGFNVKLKLLENYVFQIDFGEAGHIITDETSPLGTGEGPNPVRLMAASVANCLAASLIFAIRKFKENPGEVSATVSGIPIRKEGRWRVEKLNVDIVLDNEACNLDHLNRALSQFEDFCIVTQSVRDGIAVDVNVYDRSNKQLK